MSLLQTNQWVKSKVILISLLCAIPMMWLGWRFVQFDLGANPVETLEHQTGIWAIYFLFATLAISSIQRKWRLNVYMPFHLLRRILGLSVFAYALAHLLIYMLFDLEFNFAGLWLDILERPFILVGMLSFMLLVPLTITSTLQWQKRLKRRWNQLHLLVYPLTFLALLHLLWIQKADFFEPIVYFILFACLIMARFQKPAPKAQQAKN